MLRWTLTRRTKK
jgi:alpha-ketoglutarate-dependent taurine dioxygenase